MVQSQKKFRINFFFRLRRGAGEPPLPRAASFVGGSLQVLLLPSRIIQLLLNVMISSRRWSHSPSSGRSDLAATIILKLFKLYGLRPGRWFLVTNQLPYAQDASIFSAMQLFLMCACSQLTNSFDRSHESTFNAIALFVVLRLSCSAVCSPIFSPSHLVMPPCCSLLIGHLSHCCLCLLLALATIIHIFSIVFLLFL